VPRYLDGIRNPAGSPLTMTKDSEERHATTGRGRQRGKNAADRASTIAASGEFIRLGRRY